MIISLTAGSGKSANKLKETMGLIHLWGGWGRCWCAMMFTKSYNNIFFVL